MSEPYYSRCYLAEKFGALAYDMNEFLEVGRPAELDDRIPVETMDRCRDSVVDKCRAIEREVTKSGGEVLRVIRVERDAVPDDRARHADMLRGYAYDELKCGSLLKTLKDVTGCEDGSWRDVLLALADLVEQGRGCGARVVSGDD